MVSGKSGSTQTLASPLAKDYLMVSLVRVLDKVSADLKKQIKQGEDTKYIHAHIHTK